MYLTNVLACSRSIRLFAFALSIAMRAAELEEAAEEDFAVSGDLLDLLLFFFFERDSEI